MQTFQNHLQTREFEDLGDRTKLTQTMRFATTDERDTTMQYGVEEERRAASRAWTRCCRSYRSTRRHDGHGHEDGYAVAESAQEGTMSPKKVTQKSAESTTASGKKSKGFTDEERAAMKERAQELEAEARKADGESAVLAKIAENAEPGTARGRRARRADDCDPRRPGGSGAPPRLRPSPTSLARRSGPARRRARPASPR